MQKIITLLIGTSILIGASCQKYEEDEFISLKTPEKRILGYWEIKSFYVDGVDSTQAAKDFVCGQRLRFLSESESVGGSAALVLEEGHCHVVTEGDYWFEDLNTTIHFSLHKLPDTISNMDYVGAFCQGKIEWEIIKLTSKELKFETSKYGLLNVLEMKKN